ncbi:MAG: SDR family NAD(P)-dependent oxidoreductase [Sphingomonadaceae bacterium]|nr:SDR family NAD(P)-dependent oxidoreductase [Sphingomonadaceae bacterium]
MIDLNNGIVVVSGGGSGIGRGLALKAAARGARVAVVDIQRDAAAETVALLAAAAGEARAYEADVTDLEALQTLASQIERDFGCINMVFNNAGVFSGGTLAQTRPQDFGWLFEVNVRGLYNAIQAFLPALERTAAAGGLAHFVNTGSENSLAVPPLGPFSAYTATKHAVFGITDCLRRDVKGSGIGVSLICPGLVQTNLWNAKRTRQDRFGGAREAAAAAGGSMAAGRTIEATADTVFEGLDAGEFLIVTDPRIRSFAAPRLDEIARALDTADARITTL